MRGKPGSAPSPDSSARGPNTRPEVFEAEACHNPYERIGTARARSWRVAPGPRNLGGVWSCEHPTSPEAALITPSRRTTQGQLRAEHGKQSGDVVARGAGLMPRKPRDRLGPLGQPPGGTRC